LTPLQLIGIGLVFLGPALTAERSSRRETPSPPPNGGDAFKPRLAEGYVFAFLSATGYGTSPILIRAGLDQIGGGGSPAGGLLSYIAATAVIAPFLLRPGQIAHVLRLEREPAKWFTLSGVV